MALSHKLLSNFYLNLLKFKTAVIQTLEGMISLTKLCAKELNSNGMKPLLSIISKAFWVFFVTNIKMCSFWEKLIKSTLILFSIILNLRSSLIRKMPISYFSFSIHNNWFKVLSRKVQSQWNSLFYLPNQNSINLIWKKIITLLHMNLLWSKD